MHTHTRAHTQIHMDTSTQTHLHTCTHAFPEFDLRASQQAQSRNKTDQSLERAAGLADTPSIAKGLRERGRALGALAAEVHLRGPHRLPRARREPVARGRRAGTQGLDRRAARVRQPEAVSARGIRASIQAVVRRGYGKRPFRETDLSAHLRWALDHPPRAEDAQPGAWAPLKLARRSDAKGNVWYEKRGVPCDPSPPPASPRARPSNSIDV